MSLMQFFTLFLNTIAGRWWDLYLKRNLNFSIKKRVQNSRISFQSLLAAEFMLHTLIPIINLGRELTFLIPKTGPNFLEAPLIDYRVNCDNLLAEFDPKTEKWRSVETSGDLPSGNGGISRLSFFKFYSSIDSI